MLPTPSTSHVDFERIYEPAEDSYLLLDTLSSETEKAFLHSRFPCGFLPPATQTSEQNANANSDSHPALSHSAPPTTSSHPSSPSPSPSPLVLEVGTGSGVVLSFVHAHASTIFGRDDVVTLGVDVNLFACKATGETVAVAERETGGAGGEGEGEGEGVRHGFYLGNVLGDLTSCLRAGEIDVLIFNPPYVPTATLPRLPTPPPHAHSHSHASPSSLPNTTTPKTTTTTTTTYEQDSHLLELSYAGGANGMETTDRLLDALPNVLSRRGCAYVLLCAQNRPREVMARVRGWVVGDGRGVWRAESVGSSGMKAGWEKLVVVRIWRDFGEEG